MISPEWLISSQKKAYKPLIKHQQPEFTVIPCKTNDELNTEKLDILASKIKWLYKTSEKYKNKVDSLLRDASEEIVFPFFEIKNPKRKKNKRFTSSLERCQNEKENDEVMSILSRHFNGEKITKIKLLALANHLAQNNTWIPKLTSHSNKNQICNWFRDNWKLISPNLGVFKCITPDGSEISENEDELFFDDDADN